MQEYFDKKGYISASFLKALDNSPKSAYAIINGEETYKSPALDFGSLVDCMLTEPDMYPKKYEIFSGKKPTDKLLDFAEQYISLYQLETITEDFDNTDLILQARALSGYDGRLLNDTVVKRFREECEPYCVFMLDHLDKIIIDLETSMHATEMVDATKGSEYLKHIFYPDENTIILYQVPIFVETTKFMGKALIDIIVINLLKRSITPYDYKTFEGNFKSNYWKYKYYYQEAWYSFLLHTISNSEMYIRAEMPEELEMIKTGEFQIMPFQFIAADKSMYREVELFESYPNIVDDVVFQGKLQGRSYNTPITPIVDLIEEATERARLGNWTTDYEMLTKGVRKLF